MPSRSNMELSKSKIYKMFLWSRCWLSSAKKSPSRDMVLICFAYTACSRTDINHYLSAELPFFQKNTGNTFRFGRLFRHSLAIFSAGRCEESAMTHLGLLRQTLNLYYVSLCGAYGFAVRALISMPLEHWKGISHLFMCYVLLLLLLYARGNFSLPMSKMIARHNNRLRVARGTMRLCFHFWSCLSAFRLDSYPNRAVKAFVLILFAQGSVDHFRRRLIRSRTCGIFSILVAHNMLEGMAEIVL